MASPFLRQTGLPQISLAKIWELADQDKDGRLSSTEFVSAMALCDAAKSGQPIPEQLPAELARGGGSSALGGMGANAPAKVEGGRMGLEEERRKNMEKGMAELERRRELIRQREEAERLEAEKKRQAAEAEKVKIFFIKPSAVRKSVTSKSLFRRESAKKPRRSVLKKRNVKENWLKPSDFEKLKKLKGFDVKKLKRREKK